MILTKYQYTQLNCVLEGMEYDGIFIPRDAGMSGEIEIWHNRDVAALLQWDYTKKIWRIK